MSASCLLAGTTWTQYAQFESFGASGREIAEHSSHPIRRAAVRIDGPKVLLEPNAHPRTWKRRFVRPSASLLATRSHVWLAFSGIAKLYLGQDEEAVEQADSAPSERSHPPVGEVCAHLRGEA